MSAEEEQEGKTITQQLERNKSDGLQSIFRLCKQAKKEKKDIIGMPCVRETDISLIVTPKEKLKVWKEYAEKLLNEENAWSQELVAEKVEGPYEYVVPEEVMEALALMNKKKAPGTSGVTSDLSKVCEKESVTRLVKMANSMLDGQKMPECCRMRQNV